MLNIHAKLNPKSANTNDELERVSMRKGFGEGLVAAAKKDRNVVGLCADLTESTHMLAFRQEFSERFVQMGIAEQNMAGVASGLAAMGKIPFMSSYAMFSPGRNWEQIRTTIAYNNVPVKIIGSHTGVNVGPDGGTHQALEDIALMRVMPNMVVISPCDSIEAKKAVLAAAITKQPTYIRLAREASPVITTEATPFVIGKAQAFWKSGLDKAKKKVGLIVTGYLASRALAAAKKLESNGISVGVLNISTIKPLDEDALLSFATEYESLVTIEDHQIAGGLGSAVAEFLAKVRPTRISFVGVNDRFGQSGKPDELIELYDLGEKAILSAAEKIAIN